MKRSALKQIALLIMPHIIDATVHDDGIVTAIWVSNINNIQVLQSITLPIEDYELAAAEYSKHVLQSIDNELFVNDVISQALGDQFIP